MGRNAELWAKMERLIREWKRSGEPGRSFAQRKGITAAKLFYWSRRVASREVLSVRRRTGSGFVPVRVVSAEEPRGELGSAEIVLASGERFRISEGVSEEMLRKVIRVLKESC